MAFQIHHEFEVPGLPDKYLLPFFIDLLQLEGKQAGEINYIFVDEEKILALNQQYLDHDYYTDVIAFDYSTGEKISGDIFISVPTVRYNASLYSTPFHKELSRVMIHGLLHLVGYKDKSEDEKRTMRKKEEEYLTRINFL